jgi:hypothetical protein
MVAMFERGGQLDNAHPVVERFLPVNLREAALATESAGGTGFFG